MRVTPRKTATDADDDKKKEEKERRLIVQKEKLAVKLREKERLHLAESDAEYQRRNEQAIVAILAEEEGKEEGNGEEEEEEDDEEERWRVFDFHSNWKAKHTTGDLKKMLTANSDCFSAASSSSCFAVAMDRTAKVLTELQLTATVHISVHYVTQFGEMLFLIGSSPLLGKWVHEKALPMKWTDGHMWRITLEHPRGELQFRFLMRDTRNASRVKTRVEEGEYHIAKLEAHTCVSFAEHWHERKTKDFATIGSAEKPSVRAEPKRRRNPTVSSPAITKEDTDSKRNQLPFGSLNSSRDLRRGMNINEESYFSHLSDEIILNILKWLSVSELLRVSQACWTLNEIAADINLWKPLYARLENFYKSGFPSRDDQVSDWRALTAHRYRMSMWESNSYKTEQLIRLADVSSGNILVKLYKSTNASLRSSTACHLISANESGSIKKFKLRLTAPSISNTCISDESHRKYLSDEFYSLPLQQKSEKTRERSSPELIFDREMFLPFESAEIQSICSSEKFVVASDARSALHSWNHFTGEYVKSSQTIGVAGITLMDLHHNTLVVSANSVKSASECSFFQADLSESDASFGKPLGCLIAKRVNHNSCEWNWIANVPCVPDNAVTLPRRHIHNLCGDRLLLATALSVFDMNTQIGSDASRMVTPLFAAAKKSSNRIFRAIFQSENHIVAGFRYRTTWKQTPQHHQRYGWKEHDSRASTSSSKPILKRGGRSEDARGSPGTDETVLLFDDRKALSYVGGNALVWDLRINRPPIALRSDYRLYTYPQSVLWDGSYFFHPLRSAHSVEMEILSFPVDLDVLNFSKRKY